MKFVETPLKGAFIIELEPVVDERGYFARSWCRREFADHGLNLPLVQCNISFNRRKGTLRGMHYQTAPHAEAKLVRCTRGRIWDVIIDLRPDSATFKHWYGLELAAGGGRLLYVPEGFAHGFQTLTDETELFYQVSEAYHAECTRGVRWNDPAFGIEWPAREPIISPRDQSFPDFAG